MTNHPNGSKAGAPLRQHLIRACSAPARPLCTKCGKNPTLGSLIAARLACVPMPLVTGSKVRERQCDE